MSRMGHLTTVRTRVEAEVLIAKLAEFGIAAYQVSVMTHSFEPVTPVDVFADGDRLDEAREIISAPPLELLADDDHEYTQRLRRRRLRVGRAVLAIYIVIPLILVAILAVTTRR